MHRCVLRLARAPLRRLAARGAATAFLLAALASAAQQRAADAPPLGLALATTLERLNAAAAGGVVLEPTAGAVGSHAEELVLSVAFSNSSDAALVNLRITSVVPADLRYVAGTATGPGSEALFSVDQGQRFGRPEELTVPSGSGGTRRADPADYTHVRFVFSSPLDPGAAGTVRLRVVPR